MIYVYGANGMLGRYVCAVLRQERKRFKKVTRENWITGLDPDSIIINCAGLIRQRNATFEDLREINTEWPNYLAKNYKKVIHISTDCVFSGKNAPYSISSSPDPQDPYGASKYLGENKKLSIIRTSFIGEELENKLSLLEWCKSMKGQTVKGYTNQIWSGVTALTVAKCITGNIEAGHFWRGPIHLCSDPISKYDLLKLISKVYDLDLKVEPAIATPKDMTLTGAKFNLEQQLYELKDFYQYL